MGNKNNIFGDKEAVQKAEADDLRLFNGLELPYTFFM